MAPLLGYADYDIIDTTPSMRVSPGASMRMTFTMKPFPTIVCEMVDKMDLPTDLAGIALHLVMDKLGAEVMTYREICDVIKEECVGLMGIAA